MARQGLDGLLLFRQESMYYLTGYDSFGYVYFQCLYLGADGRMTLLTRAPDLRQARETSVIEDIRIWIDGPEASPAQELRVLLAEHGCQGKRPGVEDEAHGWTARPATPTFVGVSPAASTVRVWRATSAATVQSSVTPVPP